MAKYSPRKSSDNGSEVLVEPPVIDESTPLLGNKKCAAVIITCVAQEETATACCGPSDLTGAHDNANSMPEYDVSGVISVLLLGVFIANADGSLVLATTGTISSEFGDLADAGWLITSYILAMCATQSLYGKLSDIYGRKATILASYVFFAIGCAICGLSQSLFQVVCGRIIAGIGGAGVNCLVSILIADIFPIRQVASWRSYVNIVATTGRSLGGPIGGWLCDSIGWRWSFLGQCPVIVIAFALVFWKLQDPLNSEISKQSQLTKLRRIDFPGALFLSLAVVCGLLTLDMGGKGMPWTHPTILALFGASLVAGSMFLLVEAFWVKEPVFPLQLLLNQNVGASYLVFGLINAAQLAIMFSVPLYFQITANASATNAGLHLMPAVIGNATGGIIAGFVIERTGRYKFMSILGVVASLISYLLLILRWHGNTNLLESLYIIPGGFGNGVVLSTTFIAVTASVDHSQVAVVSSGLYLSSNIGMVSGLSVASAVLQNMLRVELNIELEGLEGREWIVNRAISDIEYVRSLKGHVRYIVVQAYIRCLKYTHGVSLVGAILALTAVFFILEHRI